ncbi:hypothetical protein [Pseudorhodoferax sp.]|uniref:hypothetical protein n=1 Tax=Pseudorhodoferax sp. TaxID=1993553 RepID=UPI0039E2528E
MRSRALALFLAVVMAWMGFSAQEQAAEISSATLTGQMPDQPPDARASGGSGGGGSLDDHHLDNLPFQLLADLVGLLGPGDVPAAPGAGVRPQPLPPPGWLAPDLDALHRPPIARA